MQNEKLQTFISSPDVSKSTAPFHIERIVNELRFQWYKHMCQYLLGLRNDMFIAVCWFEWIDQGGYLGVQLDHWPQEYDGILDKILFKKITLYCNISIEILYSVITGQKFGRAEEYSIVLVKSLLQLRHYVEELVWYLKSVWMQRKWQHYSYLLLMQVNGSFGIHTNAVVVSFSSSNDFNCWVVFI